MRISRDMLMGDLIRDHPDAVEILLDEGMQCVGCHVAGWETLEQAAQSHGIDIEALLKKLGS